MNLISMKFNEKKRKFNIVVEDKNKLIKYSIPSKDLPLINSKRYKAFNSENTTHINDSKLSKIIDGLKAEVGRCYTNSDLLYNVLIKEGYNPEFYAGWIIIGGVPIYHAWIVLEENIIDMSMNPIEELIMSNLESEDINDARNMRVLLHNKLKLIPTSKTIVLGQAMEGVQYIGCNTNSQNAINHYWQVVENKDGVLHKLQTEGMDLYGASHVQKEIMKSND